jgi:hypothetical protein
MIALVWSLSVAIRRYLCSYMPTNIAIDLLRTAAVSSGPCRLRSSLSLPTCLRRPWRRLLSTEVALAGSTFSFCCSPGTRASSPHCSLSHFCRRFAGGTSSVLRTAEPSIGHVALHQVAEGRLGSRGSPQAG